MTDQAGTTTSTSASDTSAAASAPAQSAPPSPKGVESQPGEGVRSTPSPGLRSEADIEAALADETDDPTLDSLVEEVGHDLIDVPSDPLSSADSESDTDSSQVSKAPKTGDGDIDFAALRQSRDAQSAALALVDAGIPEATVKSLYRTDPAGLIAFAQRIAGGDNDTANKPGADTGGNSKQPKQDQRQDDPFASIFEEASSGLKDYVDEESIPKFVEPLRAVTGKMREFVQSAIDQIRSDYEQRVSGLQFHAERVESEYARRHLMNSWPQLKNEANYNAVREKMLENGKNGRRFNSIEEMMNAAATDLWSGEKELTRRKQASQSARDRAIGQPTIKDGRTDAPSSVKEVSFDEWEKAIYTARSNASQRGEDPDAAVARVKARLKVKPGSKF